MSLTEHFALTSDYIMNISEIDAQHRHFASILDKVYDAILHSSPREVQGGLLDDLINYAVIHFGTEEKYFDQFNYEGAVEHKAEHRKLEEQVLKFQTEFKSGEKDISVELIDFLEDWLINHLMVMDKKYVDCFHKNGLK